MFVFSRFMRYFLEVARQGSIRKASERLNVSASAIDRQILAAEEKLGIALFERLPSGLRVTAAGELLLMSGGRWTREFERLKIQIDDLTGLRRGHVRIAAIDALSKGFLPLVLHGIRQDYPGITAHVSIVDNVAVQGLVQNGDVDFGLMLSPKSSKDTIVQAHRDIVLGFATQPHHPLASDGGVRFSRGVEFPLIAPAAPLALCDQVAALEAATGITIAPVIASNDIQMMKSLVATGTGIGILTSLDVMEEVRIGTLAFTQITDSVLRPMPLALCVGHARQVSHAARLALDRVEQALLQSDEPQSPGQSGDATGQGKPE